MDAPKGPTSGEVLAALLDSTGQIVTSVLRADGVGESGAYSPLTAVAAARTLADVSEDVLRELVSRARATGATWQDIGDVLRVSRQAAQKRFGAYPGSRHGWAGEEETMERAGERAVEILDDQVQQRWESILAACNEEMAAGLTQEMLESAWAQVQQTLGAYRDRGEPVVRGMQGHTVVNTPMRFERGEMKSRIAFDPEGKIAGYFILRPEVL